MKPLKPTFLIAVAVLLGLLPQDAQASCSGNACSAYSVENKSYSSSEKRFHATLLNKDQSKKIRLKGCMGVPGTVSSYCWDVTIDPGKRQAVDNGLSGLAKPEEAAKNFVLDIWNADFVQEHVLYSPPTPPKAPPPEPKIKVSIVNGAPGNLKIWVTDLNDHVEVFNRIIASGLTIELSLSSRGGKGHLKWEADTTIPSDFRAGQPGQKPKNCGDGEVDNVAPGAKITITATKAC